MYTACSISYWTFLFRAMRRYFFLGFSLHWFMGRRVGRFIHCIVCFWRWGRRGGIWKLGMRKEEGKERRRGKHICTVHSNAMQFATRKTLDTNPSWTLGPSSALLQYPVSRHRHCIETDNSVSRSRCRSLRAFWQRTVRFCRLIFYSVSIYCRF